MKKIMFFLFIFNVFSQENILEKDIEEKKEILNILSTEILNILSKEQLNSLKDKLNEAEINFLNKKIEEIGILPYDYIIFFDKINVSLKNSEREKDKIIDNK